MRVGDLAVGPADSAFEVGTRLDLHPTWTIDRFDLRTESFPGAFEARTDRFRGLDPVDVGAAAAAGQEEGQSGESGQECDAREIFHVPSILPIRRVGCAAG